MSPYSYSACKGLFTLAFETASEIPKGFHNCKKHSFFTTSLIVNTSHLLSEAQEKICPGGKRTLSLDLFLVYSAMSLIGIYTTS
jgi:hypothetical protein